MQCIEKLPGSIKTDAVILVIYIDLKIIENRKSLGET
jgi:hypothetical protein